MKLFRIKCMLLFLKVLCNKYTYLKDSVPYTSIFPSDVNSTYAERNFTALSNEESWSQQHSCSQK